MSRWIAVDQPMHDYIVDHLPPESALFARLREETSRLPNAGMQISHEQARLMALLIRSSGARRCIEVGVFTGYSSLTTALALPEDGYLLACDISDEYTSVARRYWQEAGVAARVDLQLAPADQTLAARIDAGERESYDFAFIDADKTGYDTYYEQCLQLLRPGGLILLDNCLWRGDVIDANVQDADTQAIRAINRKLADDERVDNYLLGVGDGIHLACKRGL